MGDDKRMAALDPPDFLNPATRTIWVSTVEQLLAAGTSARVNPDSLLAFVSAVASHQRATALLMQTDILVDRNGVPSPNPALEIQKHTAGTIAAFAKQFGLNRRTLTPIDAPAPISGRGRWCDQHARYECTSDRSRGRGICHGIAVVGLGRCNVHAGVKVSESPAHLLAVEHLRNPLAGEPADIGPAEALLWRVRVLAGEVARLDDTIAALERDELVWGKVSETDDDSGDHPAKKTVYAARLNIWLVLRKERETALGAACEAALRANIEDRIVKLAEQQGMVVHRMITVILADFGVLPDDPRIGEIVPRRIRELTA